MTEFVPFSRVVADLSRLHLDLLQQMSHDDNLLDMIGLTAFDLYYQPLAPHLEIYNLTKEHDGSLVDFWIRSPENLDVRLLATTDRHVGRSVLTLDKQAPADGGWNALPCRTLHDSDSTQVLLLPADLGGWTSGMYQLTLTCHRNYGDEDSTSDHRYDRRVEKRQDSDLAETVWLEWRA
jgi:hypothetical protein